MLTSWYLLEPGIILDFVLASVVLLCKKKPHIKLLFVFTKVLSKQKFTSSLLVTAVDQFSIKTTILKKAIYFLSLMSYSINKPINQALACYS